MEKILSLPKLIINFFNIYFEQILIILLIYVIAVAVSLVAIRVRNIRRKTLVKILNFVLHYCLLAGFAMLIAMTIYSGLINLTKKAALDFSYKVTPTTEWVKEDLKIYFIHENQLVRINANGSDREVVFESPDTVRAYHFSPDGKFLLIATEYDLWMLDRLENEKVRIDFVTPPAAQEKEGSSEKYKGVLDGVNWSPDSQRFCYHIAKWTNFSSIHNWVIYNVPDRTKRSVKSPSLKMTSLLWDTQGESLYYLWFNALDTTLYANRYEVQVYEIPLATLKPRLIIQFPFDEETIPLDNLALRDIHIYTGGEDLSFGREGRKHYSWVSKQGSRLGVDDFDHLYYIHNRWWKRKLYRIPRVPRRSDMPRYQYGGGELAIQHLRWMPSGRYVMMEHYFLGLLILDPQTGEIGLLVNEKEGDTFGWYSPEP